MIERAAGRCEVCGQRRPLEAHHVRALVLGGAELTDTDDLLALCHECHDRLKIGRLG